VGRQAGRQYNEWCNGKAFQVHAVTFTRIALEEMGHKLADSRGGLTTRIDNNSAQMQTPG
jgi:hypothetical protein